MSLNIVPIQTVRTVDEVLNLKGDLNYSCFDGGAEVSYQQFEAQSNNNSNITIICNPPSDNIVIDPVVYQSYKLTFTYSATNTQGISRRIIDTDDGLELGRPIADCLRQFPIAQISGTPQLKINSASVMTNLTDYFNEAIRFSNSFKKQDRAFSMTASQLDQQLTYESLYGTNRSPFAQYGANPHQQSRASFPNFKVISNPLIVAGASGVATVEVTVYEPLFVSPFYFSKKGISGVRTMTYTNVLTDLTRMLCRSPVNGNTPNPPLTLTGLTGNVNAVKLLFKYITPKQLDVIPKQLVYGYNEFVPTIQSTGGLIATNTSATLTMNALNLQAIPKRLLVYVKEKREDIEGFLNIGKPDVINALIENISLNFQNRTGLLSSATEEDLYQMSRANGIDMSYGQWKKEIGSILAIDLGKDIGLPSGKCAGLLDNPQLSMNVKFKNISAVSKKFSLYVIVVYEGTFSIVNGNISKQVGVLTQQDVINAEVAPKVFVDREEPKNYAGGFVLPLLKLIRQGVQIGAPIAKKVADVAQMVGVGRIGGKYKKRAKKYKAKGLMGGARFSRSDLMNALGDEY